MAGTCHRCKHTALINKRIGGKVITWCPNCDGTRARQAAAAQR